MAQRKPKSRRPQPQHKKPQINTILAEVQASDWVVLI